jgi:hypothetical protein
MLTADRIATRLPSQPVRPTALGKLRQRSRVNRCACVAGASRDVQRTRNPLAHTRALCHCTASPVSRFLIVSQELSDSMS